MVSVWWKNDDVTWEEINGKQICQVVGSIGHWLIVGITRWQKVIKGGVIWWCNKENDTWMIIFYFSFSKMQSMAWFNGGEKCQISATISVNFGPSCKCCARNQ